MRGFNNQHRFLGGQLLNFILYCFDGCRDSIFVGVERHGERFRFLLIRCVDRFKVEFADEVNLAGGKDLDGNLLQGWDIDWGCTDSSYW